VIFSARQGDSFTEVYNAEAPADVIHVEIARPELLSLDGEGGLHLSVRISDVPKAQAARADETRWKIRYLELEVTGTGQ
jgi:hypothetical protein